MLSLTDGKARLWRYKIEHEHTDYATSEQEKESIEQRLNNDNIEYTTTAIDQSENEWIDGLEFKSRDEAMEMLSKGQAYYHEKLQETNAQLALKVKSLANENEFLEDTLTDLIITIVP